MAMPPAPGPADRPDADLVAAARAGDAAAFAALVERYHPPLLRYLQRKVGDPALAEDLLQETFFVAFRHLAELAPEQPVAPWLYRIAQLNLAFWRRRWRPALSLDRLLAVPPPSPLPAALLSPDATGPSAERALIEQILAELSPGLREALLLHALAGFTAPEVATILGILPAAAEKRIDRAAARFRARYRELTAG